MVTFCKNVVCPSSQDLLVYQRGETSSWETAKIEMHIAECEFCASEVEFYAHYPQAEEPVGWVEIPRPLYELAEALLGNKHKDFSFLNRLLCENEGIQI
jgi:hypothetical protein